MAHEAAPMTEQDVRNRQRTPEGLAYEKMRKALRARARNLSDPSVKKVNEEITRAKAVSPGSVHVVSTLSTMSVQYKNDAYIGTDVMPILTVGKLSDKFFKYP